MKAKKILYWSPRILAILFIAFISLFALDVFGESRWLLALLMHLVPSFILVLLTVVAWKHGRIGGILFFGFGIAAAIFFRSIGMAVSSFVIGTLFLVEITYKKVRTRKT